MNLRLLSYNIRTGGIGREDALTDCIQAAAPDLVVLQEATHPEVVQRLASATGMTTWAAEHFQSVAFMTRLQVLEHGWFRPPPCRRAFLEIVLAGTSSRIYGVHLSAAHTHWMEGRRVREMRAMLAVIAARQHGFHVLAGDFNTLAPGERLDLGRLPLHLQLLARIGGPTIRWRTVQIMLDAGYADSYRVLHPEPDGATFPTWSPQLRLDYVFVPAAGFERVRHCEVQHPPRARAASDHLPLRAELDL